MIITDFTKKSKLVATDSLIGFDEKGNLIRISAKDLAASLGVTTVKAETVQVQYSLNKSSWHTPFAKGDRYMRVKCGSGAWSEGIRISVSAYETWRDANGGKGTEEEFLKSIQGEAGSSVDVSKLQISEMGGYKDFLSSIEGSIADAVGIYQKAVTAKLTALEDRLKEVTSSERSVIPLSGDKNGKNVTFTADTTFVSGTSKVFINGIRYIAGSDYLEIDGSTIILLTHVPSESDVMVLIAVKSETEVSEGGK